VKWWELEVVGVVGVGVVFVKGEKGDFDIGYCTAVPAPCTLHIAPCTCTQDIKEAQ
jgi:hypothetical protein